MDTPAQLREFKCDDYFASPWAESGYWCEDSQLMVVVPAAEAELLLELGLFVIGRPGVDGISFGYRRGHDGIWAYYPIGREFARVADSTADLIEGWVSNRIKV